MIRIKEHKQNELFDPWSFLSPKRRELLDQSWAGLFQRELLCELPVGEVVPFFTNGFGRPTKELYTVLGALVLQQVHDFTDDETVNQLSFNIQWHYALKITEESDSAKYMCPKTLWNMRSIVVDNALDAVLFDHITDKLSKVFKVNTDNQRIDSVHIKSNMRRLGRIGIFTSSINKFLVNLKRSHKEQFDTVEKDIIDRYLSEKSLECFSMVKPSGSAKTLASVSADLFNLVEQFKDHPDIKAMQLGFPVSQPSVGRILEQCGFKIKGERPLTEPFKGIIDDRQMELPFSSFTPMLYPVKAKETPESYTTADKLYIKRLKKGLFSPYGASLIYAPLIS